MTRRYYSSRMKPGRLTLEQLFLKLQNLFFFFQDKDFFKEKGGIERHQEPPEQFKREAAIALDFPLFPFDKWTNNDIAPDHIFDAIEFLYDHVSKPGKIVSMTTETGFNYEDYGSYDNQDGQEEFRNKANTFLTDFGPGFELTKDGIILALGTDGLQHILDAEIIPYDKINVDDKVRNAISKWRNRHLTISEKKEAIREIADVFEWLKKTGKLQSILDGKDESAFFNIANNFGIRHHDPKQKTQYDQKIWFSWIFHFYLATYHAVIRLLTKKEGKVK
jgi:hypothetical protein